MEAEEEFEVRLKAPNTLPEEVTVIIGEVKKELEDTSTIVTIVIRVKTTSEYDVQ